ncbi:MAG: hypothetical protein IIZ67_06955 [Bacilli bacterium]|nr:hypothetical protein [Bacilli bacterium]
MLDKFNYSLLLFTIFTVILMGLIPVIIRKASSDAIDRLAKKNKENNNKKDK